MNAILEQINSAGLKFVEFALPMLVQSVVLIVILLLTDFAMRKKVRAVFRYWIWLLVLVKLVLPTSLSSPMSLGHFFGDRLTYVDRTETPSEPQANLIEPVPVNVPPFIDLADIDTDRFAPTVPPPIAVTEKVKESAMTSLAAPPAISVTPLSWRGAVFLIWLAAVFAMTLLLLQRAIFVRGLVAQAKEVNGSMTDMLESCRASMSVKRKLGLKISANAASPAVCGLFSPVILVPQNLASSLTANQLKAVLLHELAHIRRGDLFVNLAQTVLQIVYFYNPMLWLANCIIRRIREQAVDEMVLVAMGEKAPQYPQTLVSVAKLAFKRPVLSLRLIGIVESKSALSGRIKHILNRPMPKKAKLGIIGLVVVVIIGAVLLPMTNSMSDSPKLVIKGVVKDAQTDEPIAGAKVFDDGYAHEPLWEQIRPDQRRQWGAITNSAGQYSFLTWPEHYSIKVEAPGYKAQRRSLYKGHFVLKTKDEEIFDFTLEQEKVSDSSEFKATLPNDVTVELIGICEHPSEGKQWWRPDGSLLEDRPYDKGITHSGDRGSKYELAFRVVNLPDPAFGWTVKSEEITVSVLSEVGKDDHDVPDIWSALVGFQEKPDKKDIRLGIAAGPWTGSGHHHTGGVTTTSDGIVFQRAVQDSQGNIVLNIIHNINQSEKSYRVIAIGENGAEYTARNSAVSRPAQPSITEAVFKNLKLSDVKEFFFQTRPYQWVEFKNVALKPNFKTDVQVEVEGARSKAPQPAGNSTNTVRQYFSRLNFRQTPDKTFVKTLHEDIEPFEERVGFFIRDYNDGVLHCIDFDNNEIVRVPDKLDINDRTAILKWAKENNVDAMFRKASSLVSINMASVMTENSETDKLSSNTLEKLSKKAVGSTDILYSTEDGYTYYAFKTSQDRIGVVGLFSSENEGLDYRSLLMSYKLLKTDVQVEPGDSGSNTDIKEEDLTYPRKVFSVYGIVTDEQGNPISDVKVSASCGIGTLFRTGETITGEIGHYKLYFGPGIRRRIQDTDQWGAGFQAATIYAQKSDLFEANLCQHGNLAMSGRADYADYYKKQMKYYKGVVLPDKPYRLDFVMLPAATIKGKLVDKKGNPISGEEIWLAGNELYPSTNALETIKTDKDGMFTLDSVPCKSFWFTHRSKRDEVRTRPINFSKPMEYEITLVYDKPVFGKPTLTCISFQESRTGQRPDVQVENKKKKPSAWLVLLPRSPIRSAKELYLYFWGSPLVSDQMKIDSFELEIRSAKENVRMVRIDCKSMITVHSSKGEVLQWSMFRDGLPENMIRRIGPLEDGEYLIAIYVNGIRSSNVAKFTVDSSFESSNEPTLQVVPLVPAPGKKLQYFGLRATGPTPQDSELTNMALHFPDIIVDGVPRKILARNWSGPVYPLKPGQQHEEILMLKYYKPEIDLSRKHTVKAVVGKYESAPIEIGFDYSLELAWDKATTTIKSRPPRPPVLEGRVIGPDGKPGIGYRVCLYADPGRNQYIEYSDKDGKYDFPNVPTGRYKLTCQPKGNSEPALTFEQFQIEANKTVVQELNLEGKYAFSGKVTYEDGSPAAGVKIVGRWEIRGGNVFRDLRVSDENGFYELAAPFKLARYISLSIFTPDGTPAQGSYEHIGVMGPRTDVDFVVKRREIHASIWPKKFARMGGKHPGFQPVPVPEGWSQTRLLETLYKYLKAQGETKLPGCIVDLKDGIIQLSHNTRDYNIIRPGNAKRTGMQRGNDRGIGPEPDGLILTVHLSDAAGQFDRPHIIDRSPWTGFISQVYLPDIKLYLNVDIQYGTGINEKLLTDLCAPTSWLKTIFNNFNERTLEQKAWGEAVEKGSQPDVQAESEIDRVIEDYGQTRLLSKKEMPDTDNWVLVWGSVVKNNGRYLVPNEGLTLKDLIKAAGYNKGKLAESYVELIRRSRQGNITARSNYSRNLKTLLSGEESDIVLKPNDAVAGGYIEPSADGVEFWSGYHFSEVVELIVNDDSAKINMFADLDAGKLITPPDTLDNNDENAVLRWIKENGIDVMGETAAGVHGLAGFNMYAARVDNYFWDAGPQEFTDRLMVRIDDPVLLSVENLLPVTYLIKTSKYKMGILQILGFTENPKGIKIRYKLLNKEAAPKTDVLLTPEPVTGNWQYIGQSIPPDYNDIITLTEHINLGSIGHDAEGKTFITIVRDGQEDRNSQYRFVLFTTNGDILEPDGHIVLSEGKRSEEKFTFDEPFITRQLKGFRFQIGPLPPPDEPPPSEIDDTSLQLQKPVSELIEGDTLLPSDLPPPGRYAIELDGVDDYLLVPDSPSLRLEPPFTIEMWIKTKLPPDASEYRGGWAVISKGFTVGTPRAYLTGFGINLHRFPKEPSNLHIDFCKANNSGTYSATYAGYPLTNGVSDWIHITHVFDGEYYKSTPGHPLVMGKFLIPINDPFKGLLGEVRLWYGARTRQELRQYKNVALTGNEPGLAACWTFEQTEGHYAYDISGNNNHARLGKFTGPDDADPNWIDLQEPSSEPDLKTDQKVEGKHSRSSGVLMLEGFYSFGEGEMYSRRLSQIFGKAQTYIERMSVGYANKDWDNVFDALIQVRDIFFSLKEAIEVDDDTAWEAFTKMWNGEKTNTDEVRLIDLARLKRTFEILAFVDGQYHEETHQILCSSIVNMADTADEIQKTLQSKKSSMISSHIEKLQANWAVLVEIDGIKEIFPSGFQTKDKTDLQVSKEISENIQVLRQSRLDQINETSIEQTRAISAMQELVRIGELAVPDLVSELRRDNNWLTKSLIAFVLRAIGDERVVPVLIEVLRQSEYRGEYGIHIQDDESAKWMLDRQHRQPDDGSRQAHQIIIACPVVEITAALEKITGHTEGHEHYGHKATAELGRNPPHEQWQKRVREIVREVADRWQKWIDLQTPSPQPNRRTDLQVEDKKRETEISGFVVDENGSSIAGATVTLLNKDLALLPKPERIGRTMRMVVFDNFYDITDTNGRFEFLDFNPGKTDIIVESQGYRTEILRDITTGTKNLKITLGKPSAYALAGEVIDGKGNPISGVEITLAEKSYKTVRTDEEGEFRFAEILEPTTVHRARALFAHKEGFGIWGKTLDTTGGETYVKITLLPEEKISGLVVDQVGRPITNATVLFWSCRGRDTDFGFSSKWREIAPRTETDTNGRFTLTGIPTESDVCIRAMAMSYASSALYCIKTGKFGSYAVRKKNERGTLVYGSNREPSETIEFKLKKAVTLIGTLTYEDSGRPAPGLRIATQSHKASQWAETRTDQAGRFRLEGVSPNPSNLLVIEDDLERDSLPQWTAAAIVFDDLKEGETRSGIRLVLTKGGIIRGKAVDAEGNPLHGIDIAFYSAARPRPGAACQSTLTVKDGTWAYRFPPGEVYVYIRTTIPEGKWSRKIYNLHLNDGQVIDNIDFELSQVVPENSPYRRDIIR